MNQNSPSQRWRTHLLTERKNTTRIAECGATAWFVMVESRVKKSVDDQRESWNLQSLFGRRVYDLRRANLTEGCMKGRVRMKRGRF